MSVFENGLSLQNGGATARSARRNVGRWLPHHRYFLRHPVHHAASDFRGQRVVVALAADRLTAHRHLIKQNFTVIIILY